MTNFSRSAQSLFLQTKNNNIWGRFIENRHVKAASEMVIRNANLRPEDIDVMHKLNLTKANRTQVYLSSGDHIVGSDIDLTTLQSDANYIGIRKYQALAHIEMMAMIDSALLSDFISDLTDVSVTPNDTAIIGKICEEMNNECTTN